MNKQEVMDDNNLHWLCVCDVTTRKQARPHPFKETSLVQGSELAKPTVCTHLGINMESLVIYPTCTINSVYVS